MQRVQAVKITLSTGLVGLFWGPVLVEAPEGPDAKAEPVSVKEIVFEPPRVVGGIEPTKAGA